MKGCNSVSEKIEGCNNVSEKMCGRKVLVCEFPGFWCVQRRFVQVLVEMYGVCRE